MSSAVSRDFGPRHGDVTRLLSRPWFEHVGRACQLAKSLRLPFILSKYDQDLEKIMYVVNQCKASCSKR